MLFQCDNKDHENGNVNVPKNVSNPEQSGNVVKNADEKEANDLKNVSTKLNSPPSPPARNKKKSAKKAKSLKSFKGVTAPRYKSNGCCARCKNENAIEESITCNLCNNIFHAFCKDNLGNQVSSSVCTKTFYDAFRPVSAKYGVNAERWGNFLFICEDCSTTFKSFAKKKKCDFKNKQIQCEPYLEDRSTSIQDFSSTSLDVVESTAETNPQNATLDSNAITLTDIKTLMSTMKEDILGCVSNIMDERFNMNIHETPKITSTNSLDLKTNVTEDSNADCTYANKLKPLNPTSKTPLKIPHLAVNNELNELSQSDKSSIDTEYVIVLETDTCDVDFPRVVQCIGDQLMTVPMNFLKEKHYRGRIIIGFPTNNDKEKAKSLLSSCPEIISNGFVVNDAKKMLPKLTVTNIPNYVASELSKNIQSSSSYDYRQNIKKHFFDKIMEKNTDISEAIRNGDSFEIIYVNVGKEYSSIGIKVSPKLHQLIMCKSNIYIGNSKCNVTDRFDIRQCFRCQKLGHTSKNCKESIICMYCSASHQTRTCPEKKNYQSHRCRNCAQSKNPVHKSNCNTHHSSSQKCPSIIKEVQRLRMCTDYSKNS